MGCCSLQFTPIEPWFQLFRSRNSSFTCLVWIYSRRSSSLAYVRPICSGWSFKWRESSRQYLFL